MLYRSRGSFSTKSTEKVRYNTGHGGPLVQSPLKGYVII